MVHFVYYNAKFAEVSLQNSLVDWLVRVPIDEVRVIINPIFQEFPQLALEVWLASQDSSLGRVCFDDVQRSSVLAVASQSQAVPDYSLLDEVVLGVLDDAHCHDVQESVTFGIWHHWV